MSRTSHNLLNHSICTRHLAMIIIFRAENSNMIMMVVVEAVVIANSKSNSICIYHREGKNNKVEAYLQCGPINVLRQSLGEGISLRSRNRFDLQKWKIFISTRHKFKWELRSIMLNVRPH